MIALGPRTTNFIGAYFNQDWDLDAPDVQSVVDSYLAVAPPEERREVQSELRTLASEGLSEPELRAILKGAGSYYYAPGAGQTYREWVLELVEGLNRERQA